MKVALHSVGIPVRRKIGREEEAKTVCTHYTKNKRERAAKDSVRVERNVDITEQSTSGNSSSVPRESLAFQETINCPGCSEAYVEPTTEKRIKCKCSELGQKIERERT